MHNTGRGSEGCCVQGQRPPKKFEISGILNAQKLHFPSYHGT